MTNLYTPFDALCACGHTLRPYTPPHAESTHPDQPHRMVAVVFICDGCGAIVTYYYTLPIIRDDVSKNLILFLKNTLNLEEPLLTTPINLKASNFDVTAQKGLGWALADLQQKNVIYDLNGFSFRVTLLGHLILWHSGY